MSLENRNTESFTVIQYPQGNVACKIEEKYRREDFKDLLSFT